MLRDNYREAKKRIDDACHRAGRSSDEVTLIAVSKTKPKEMIREIYDEGQRDFGENKVQEMMEKEELLPEDIRWHMIGHLQRNKVKYLASSVSLIHSVDSVRLAQTISEEAAKHGRVISILIELNAAGETTKFGVSLDETEKLIREVAALPGVSVKGLMTVAPYVSDPEENRDIFREMKKLSVDIRGKNINNVTMDVLSMGMTNDYEVAIEEGSTMVRIGTGIFGERHYNI